MLGTDQGSNGLEQGFLSYQGLLLDELA